MSLANSTCNSISPPEPKFATCGIATRPRDTFISMSLEEVNAQRSGSRALLREGRIPEQSLDSMPQQSATNCCTDPIMH